MRVNINDHVIVQLTDFGKRKLFEFWDKYKLDAGKIYSIQENNFIEIPIWEMMQVFGPYTFHGMPEMPFVDNLIEIKKMVT